MPPKAADAAIRLAVPGARLADGAAALPTDRCAPIVSAASATGSAEPIGPDFHWLRQFKSVSANKKSAIPVGMTDFLELLARFELATSSLPRMRSTG